MEDGAERARLRELITEMYPQLHRIARRKLGMERRRHTLEPTGLTNEVVIRLLQRELSGDDPQAVMWAGIVEMRRILIDYGRKHQVRKRYLESLSGEEPMEVIDEAVHIELLLDQLAEIDPRGRQVVELRFFLGLSVKECAEILGLSMRTVSEDWEFAKRWMALRWKNS